MDKVTAKKRDDAWKEVASRVEKAKLAKLSQQLISVFELGKLWLSLKDGECLVLSSDGSIHKGERTDANLHKMHKLQEAFRTTEKLDILAVHSDPKTAAAIYPLSGGFNNRNKNWDTRSRLADGRRPTHKGKAPEPVMIADDI